VTNKRYKTGLVLSGGAARGFAHLGVFRALQEYGIVPDIISGVSAGALAGAFYCDGYTPEEILATFDNSKIFHFVKLNLNRRGLFNPLGLRNHLKKHLKATRIEELKVPLLITATDINTGKPTIFREGELVTALMASSCIPVIFRPVDYMGATYIDGGITNNFPTEPLSEICDRVIGVHVNPVGSYSPKWGLIQTGLYSFHLSISSLINKKKEEINLFIEPGELTSFTYHDIEGRHKMYEIGYTETIKVLEQNKGFR
jgi:NTE family protein